MSSLFDNGSWRDLPVGGLQKLCDLVPVDDIAFVQCDGEPAAVAVVRRAVEPTVLAQRIPLVWVGEEVERQLTWAFIVSLVAGARYAR